MPAKRNQTTETLTALRAALIKIKTEYQSELSTRGLRSLPPGAREFVRAAQAALSEVESAIGTTTDEVSAVMGDQRIYPEGRKLAAREKLAALEQLVADKTAVADRALGAARVTLQQQALRPVDRREEMVARADAQMILDRTDPKNRDNVMAELAKRQDAIGALVSSQWGRDYLSTMTPDATLADAMHGAVVRSAVDAAAAQHLDEDRRDAAQHLATLPTLQGLRDATMHTGNLIAETLRDDHNLPAGVPATGSYVSQGELDAMASDAEVSDNPIGSLTL